ncbi:MAG TPA: alanine dehydrogenase [Phycisphaerae bacterium]|nr:alanine dehydrogenase [Phycisphaerae bacterium]
MKIGVPREVKADEYRVGMVPAGAKVLSAGGHQVMIEAGAGLGSGIADEEYVRVGAEIVPSAADLWQRADMVVKVKEPQEQEWPLMKRGQVVLTYFHFAADKKLIEACLSAGIVAVAYETIKNKSGHLPCLTPMSEVAGKMSIQEGAKYLERPQMGRGILLGGVPGVAPANVVVLGAGVVGHNAAKVAAGLGANVTLMDINLERLRYLDDVMAANVTTVYSDPLTVRQYLQDADLVIGAVLIPGARAPRLVTHEDLKIMKNGSVIVDVAIDQGGCVETSRPTTHKDPTYIVEGVVHYCVTNMPGAVGRTSTFALCNATLPYGRALADKGWQRAAEEDLGLAEGINIHEGLIRHAGVRRAWEG